MAAMGMGLLSVCCSLGVLGVPQQKKHHLSFSRTETLVSQQAAASASLTLTSTTAGGLELQSQSQSLLPLLFSVYCGRGDKKTAKGKRFKHSFGNARPRDRKKGRGPPRVAAPPPALSPPKKDKFDDGEIIKIEIIHHDDD